MSEHATSPKLIEETRTPASGRTTESRDQMRARLEQEFGRPAVPVPQGVAMTGTLERIESTAAGLTAAIVVGLEAIHVVRVTPDAKELIGLRVDLRNVGGVVKFEASPPAHVVTRESIASEAERQYGRPALGNFHGAQGRLERVVSDGAGAHWAVVVGANSVYVVAASARERLSVGERVTLERSSTAFELRTPSQSLGR